MALSAGWWKRALRPKDWSIFAKMLCGILAVVSLALGLTTLVNTTRLQRDLRDQIGLEHETLARAQANHLGGILSEQLSILRAIALTDQVRAEASAANARYGGDRAAIEARLQVLDYEWQAAGGGGPLGQSTLDPELNPLTRQLLSLQDAFPHHTKILLTDRYGGLVSSTHRTARFCQANEEWWQAAYQGGQGALHVGQPTYDESTGHSPLNMAVPIRSEAGELIGIVRTSYRTDAIHRAVDLAQIDETAQIRVVGPTGLIIADSRDGHVGMQASPSYVSSAFSKAASGWHDIIDDEGVKAVAGHAAVSSVQTEHEAEAEAIRAAGWTLFATQSQAEAYAPVRRTIWEDYVTGMVFALLAGGLAFLLGHATIVRPLASLVGAARGIAGGDLSARAQVERQDEMGELAQAFNGMADEVALMVESLERRVADRTAQLAALREVGLEITGQLDPDAVLHSIVSRATELLGATMGGLYLYRPEHDVIEGVTWVSPRPVPDQLTLRRGEGLSGTVWETERPLIVDDYKHWKRRPAMWEGYPAASVLGVPVRWGPEGEGGEFLGVLDVASDAPHAFSPADADLLSLFASQAAIAVHNAQLYRAEQQRAEELQVAYVQLQRAQEALVQAERLSAMSQIGITVRHEINNPLTAVLGNVQWLLMSDTGLSSSSRDLAEEIEEAALRIRDVVRRLDEIEDRPVPYLQDLTMIDLHSREEEG